MVSDPEELGLQRLILDNPELFYETIVRAVFRNAEVSFYKKNIWDDLWRQLLDEDKLKAKRVCHFYYYTCLPFKETYEMPDSVRLVFTASIMESLMVDNHKDFYKFLNSKDCESISKQELNVFHEEYVDQYGCRRNFRRYFEQYFSSEDLRWLLHLIKRKKDGVLSSLSTAKELADFFYALRNDSAHNARLFIISKESIGQQELKVGGREYKVNIDIYNYFKAFERSLVSFFTNTKQD